MGPDDETKEIKITEIEEYPATCSECGSPAYLGLKFYHCSNQLCKNYSLK